MSQNYSEITQDHNDGLERSRISYRWSRLFILPAWVFISVFTAQLIIIGVIWVIKYLHIPIESLNQTVLNTTLSAILYILTLTIVITIPWLIKSRRTSKQDIGLTRLPTWTDILLAPGGFITYLILSSLLILLATTVLPGFDINQVQDTGFSHLNQNYELILAFITLVVVAPIAEEVLFRGYLYGKLKKFVPVWVAIIVTSLSFGVIHGAWNLAIDTFALSLILCTLREITGNIWASILLHMIKNGVAFYILFISPSLLTTLVR